jgi:hypothetical protein
MTQENYDMARKGIWFSMEIGSDEFLAFVSDEALREHFDASLTRQSQLAAFKENRKLIVSLARQRFLDGAVRPVKLQATDFETLSVA